MNNLKSYTEYAVTTPTTDFVIGFEFNYGTDAVNVTVDNVPATEAGYSVIYLNSTTMRLSPAVPSGVVRLQRETNIDVPDNKFTAGAKFNASNMDENFSQIRHSQQEVRDGFSKLSDDTYEIIDTLQVVGQAAQDAADAAEQAAQTANDAAAQVNDKVAKSSTLPTYLTIADGVNPVTGVADGAYFNVRSEDDDTVAIEYQNVNGSAVATGKSYLSALGVQLQEKSASTIKDASGKSQQEVNDNLASADLGTYTIKDADGLFYFESFKKPPYTTEEYDHANFNGIRISEIITNANAGGFTKVKFPKDKKIPFIYKSSGSENFNVMVANGAIDFDSVKNMEIDFNGCTLFVIFDSNVKHQYNLTSENFPAYKLVGSLLSHSNSRSIKFSNGIFRGDMYNRSWVVGENQVEQTHGIRSKTNCRDIHFKNMKFTGFRADGASGAPRGTEITRLITWYSGGLNLETGAEITRVGSYKSERIDLAGVNIIDNLLQLYASSGLYQIPWRNPMVQVFFFRSDESFIEVQRVRQSQDISVPVNARYVQVVALDDERTSATVEYNYAHLGQAGNTVLGTGMSSGFYFDKDCEFYENHRGGISNLGNNTLIDHSRFRDSGRLSKLGFPQYNDSTQYAVNFEDVYLSKLEIQGATAINTPQGFLGNCGEFIVNGCTLQNQYYYAINDYSSCNTRLTNNLIENARLGAFSFIKHQTETKSTLTIDNNEVRESSVMLDCSAYGNQTIKFTNNHCTDGSVILLGDGRNLEVSNNSFTLIDTGASTSTRIRGVVGGGNQFNYSKPTRSLINTLDHIGIKDTVLLYSPDQQVNSPDKDSERFTRNNKFISDGKVLRFTLNNSNSGWGGHIDKHKIESCEFSNVAVCPRFVTTGATSYPLEFIMRDVILKDGSHIRYEKRDANPLSNSITIIGATFDVTSADYVFLNIYNVVGSLDIKFINCTFVSETPKSIAILRAGSGANLTNITSETIGCRLLNVTNTDGLTIVS